jgi:glycosyltransferase involved in cell wall biosynthesis
LSLIIVDDGSTDDELLVFLGSLDKAKVITFPENRGLAAALNAGM